jgi:hypothetical protein
VGFKNVHIWGNIKRHGIIGAMICRFLIEKRVNRGNNNQLEFLRPVNCNMK